MMLVQKTKNVLQNLQSESPQYIFKLIPEKTNTYTTMHIIFPVLKLNTTSSKTLSFFLQSLNETI